MTTISENGDSRFYMRWIIANGWGEAIGLGVTFILGSLAAPALEQSSSPIMIVAFACLAVLLGTALEGVVVGFAQSFPLREILPNLRPRSWIVATAIGAGAAWLIGMLPSTLISLLNPSSNEGFAAEPPGSIQYVLAVALGVFVGPILGLAQWVVLRKHSERAIIWLWANSLAWGVGMPAIFLGMEFVPWNGGLLSQVISVLAICFVVGLVVGSIHGWFLVRLFGTPSAKNSKKRFTVPAPKIRS